MGDLDEQTVIDAGGWDGRFAVVRAVGTLGDLAAAVVDANGDGADINLEFFERAGDTWELCCSGGDPATGVGVPTTGSGPSTTGTGAAGR